LSQTLPRMTLRQLLESPSEGPGSVEHSIKTAAYLLLATGLARTWRKVGLPELLERAWGDNSTVLPPLMIQSKVHGDMPLTIDIETALLVASSTPSILEERPTTDHAGMFWHAKSVTFFGERKVFATIAFVQASAPEHTYHVWEPTFIVIDDLQPIIYQCRKPDPSGRVFWVG